jgi:hypothetical protein
MAAIYAPTICATKSACRADAAAFRIGKEPTFDETLWRSWPGPRFAEKPLRLWKAEGVCRYIGVVTLTRHADFSGIEAGGSDFGSAETDGA